MLTKAEIKRVRALGDKAQRAVEGLFVAEGEKLVGELLNSEFAVRELYRTGGNVTPAEMGRLSFLRTPTTALAVAEIPTLASATELYSGLEAGFSSGTFSDLSLRAGLVLALDEVQDPGNLGTIIRLADWFGVRDVFCSPGTADCWSPKVVQATMGAILRVRVHYEPLVPFLTAAGKAGMPIYGTFLEGENIYKCDLAPGAGVIVMGNEGRGISPDIEELVSRKLYIPPYPAASGAIPSERGSSGQGSESLNVATATAIVLSECRRREFEETV